MALPAVRAIGFALRPERELPARRVRAGGPGRVLLIAAMVQLVAVWASRPARGGRAVWPRSFRVPGGPGGSGKLVDLYA